MPRYSIAIAGAIGFCATAVMGERLIVAQANPPIPSVSVRRITSLTSDVVTGDFNHDGIVDLASTAAAATTEPRAIVVALGRGDASFGAPQPVGPRGAPLAAADFNHDGKLDLIAADYMEDAPLRLLPGKGDGTFLPPVKIGAAVVHGLTFAAVADFDGDGALDVAVGFIDESDNDGVLIYAGRGDGTFSDVMAFLPTGILSLPNGAVVADLNRDGKPDLVVANRNAKAISIFVNHGGFNFGAADRQMVSPANDVTAADVNGDGKLDLIVAESVSDDGDRSYSNGSVWVYLGNGDGTIADFGHVYSMGRGAWRVVTGDFNRDGRLDIATANRSAIAIVDCGPLYKTWDSISILTGRGDGTFAASGSTDYSIGNQRNVDDPRYRNSVSTLAVADVNGDHAPDLLVSDGVVFVNMPPDPDWAPTVTAGPDQTFNGTHTVTLRAVGDDVDQDVLRYAWESNTGLAIPPVPNPCLTVPGDGTFSFVVTVFDLRGHEATATVHDTFTGGTGFEHPSVTVTAPSADEVLTAGSAYTIRWDATAGTYPIGRFDVRFTADPAVVPTAVPGCTNLPASARSCVWSNPNPQTENGLIQVDAQPTSGPGSGTSVSPIRIRAAGGGGTLPYGWTAADVGGVGAAGRTTHDGFIYNGEGLTLSGSGADIWGTADEFHYAWRPITGDFEAVTRVASIDPNNAWTKAGLMVRAVATGATSPHVSIFATPSKGIAFQRRTVAGGVSSSTAGPALTAPLWLRMVRVGNVIKAYYRKNPTDTWTPLGQQAVNWAATVNVGLAVTSHADGSIASAKFMGVWTAQLPQFTGTAIGAATGSATTDGTSYTVKGSGADVWGTSDSFFFLATKIGEMRSITARVRVVGDTNPWAKAGVMIRESLAAGSKHADAIVSPSKGMAMQSRSTTGGATASAVQLNGAAPLWLRLRRFEGVSPSAVGQFATWYSTDGVIWRVLGTVAFNTTHDAYIGIAVTGHQAGVETTAVIDDVRIEP